MFRHEDIKTFIRVWVGWMLWQQLALGRLQSSTFDLYINTTTNIEARDYIQSSIPEIPKRTRTWKKRLQRCSNQRRVDLVASNFRHHTRWYYISSEASRPDYHNHNPSHGMEMR